MPAHRLPRQFRKPISRSRFEKKVLGKVYLVQDREFMRSLFAPDGEGRMAVARELSADERKRLSRLAKEIRSNRGAVGKGKITVLFLIVAAVLVFDFAFKNNLAARGTEDLLQTVFQAKADIGGMDFRPLRGDLSFAWLTIADRNHPMSNLFQLGQTQLQIDTWQLLRGNVVISQLTSGDIRWNTPRKVSGSTSVRMSNPHPNASPGPETAAGGGFNLGLPGTMDVKTFVADHLTELKTPARIDALGARTAELQNEWAGRTTALEADLKRAQAEVGALGTVDVAGISNLNSALAAFQRVEAAQTAMDSVANEAERAYRAADTNLQSVRNDISALPGSVQADAAHLATLLPDLSGSAKDVIARLAEPAVRSTLGNWYGRILQGYEIATRLSQSASRAKPRTRRLPGRNVIFPTARVPRFLLKSAAVTAVDGGATVTGSVRSLSSDPVLTGSPATFAFERKDGLSRIAVSGSLDTRTSAKDRASISVALAGRPVDMTGGIPALEVSRLTATAGGSGDISLESSGGARGSIRLELSAVDLEGSYSANSIGGLVNEVVTGAKSIDVSFDYRIGPDGSVALSDGRTSVDRALEELLRSRAGGLLSATRTRVGRELDTIIALKQPTLNAAQARVNTILGQTQTLRDGAEQSRRQIAAIRAKVDARIAELKAQAVAPSAAKARQQVQNQLDSVKKGLKLPGLGQ